MNAVQAVRRCAITLFYMKKLDRPLGADSATLPMTGIGKLKSISECLQGVGTSRLENSKLMIANGWFPLERVGLFLL
jgi:hypothetical protein